MKAIDADKVFKALADPIRRKLLDLLCDRNWQTLGEPCEHLDMARQSVTRRLGILETANLVSTVILAREKPHFINPVPRHEVCQRWVRKFGRQRLGLPTQGWPEHAGSRQRARRAALAEPLTYAWRRGRKVIR